MEHWDAHDSDRSQIGSFGLAHVIDQDFLNIELFVEIKETKYEASQRGESEA